MIQSPLGNQVALSTCGMRLSSLVHDIIANTVDDAIIGISNSGVQFTPAEGLVTARERGHDIENLLRSIIRKVYLHNEVTGD